MSGLPPDAMYWLFCGVALIALLYSSVGHAGASGYIAVMGLLGLAPATIKPAALVLNLLVASIATWQFARAGYFRWANFWPFALPAVPCAFLGGALHLPTRWLAVSIGVALVSSAVVLLLRPPAETETRMPPLRVALAVGASLGMLAGLTGTGGGVYLTPMLIFLRWAPTRTASAVSALFILLNSAAGLAGHFSADQEFPDVVWPLLPAALCGGALGAWLGSTRYAQIVIKRVLSIVLFSAGFKLALGA